MYCHIYDKVISTEKSDAMQYMVLTIWRSFGQFQKKIDFVAMVSSDTTTVFNM